VSGAAGALPSDEPNGPLVQSISIAFRVGVVATLLLALGWLASNVRQVPPDTTAVVSRFGRIVQVRSAGLLLAWPRPIESVRLLPGPDRQLPLIVERQPPALGIDGGARPMTPSPRISPSPQFGTAGSYLTGDGGVVLLDVALTWRITDPAAFMLAETHVSPALNRLLRAAAVSASAHHPLDDFLVVDTEGQGGRPAATRATASAALREEIVATMNARLAALGLGVAVTRLDLTAALPPVARGAFERVLTAGQQADQNVAVARTEATRRLQEADRDSDNLLNEARARAAERVTTAQTESDPVLALEARAAGGATSPDAAGSRANLLDQVYRDRMATIMPTIGHVTAVDPRGSVRLIVPGGDR
jgi:regulator of protease activity HflC (stomatin/prohibitin superfamily)